MATQSSKLRDELIQEKIGLDDCDLEAQLIQNIELFDVQSPIVVDISQSVERE